MWVSCKQSDMKNTVNNYSGWFLEFITYFREISHFSFLDYFLTYFPNISHFSLVFPIISWLFPTSQLPSQIFLSYASHFSVRFLIKSKDICTIYRAAALMHMRGATSHLSWHVSVVVVSSVVVAVLVLPKIQVDMSDDEIQQTPPGDQLSLFSTEWYIGMAIGLRSSMNNMVLYCLRYCQMPVSDSLSWVEAHKKSDKGRKTRNMLISTGAGD